MPMIRRTFTFAVGFGLGMYAAERLRRSAARLTPASMRQRVAASVRAALEEGRLEARRRDLELRWLLAAPSTIEPMGDDVGATTASGRCGSADRRGRR